MPEKHKSVFQSTLPRGERLFLRCNSFELSSFQSTLPRGERLVPALTTHDRHDISIHAPARGATHWRRILYHRKDISIHAPARGATDKSNQKINALNDFNPRSREGSDIRPLADKFKEYQFQSTLPRGERQIYGVILNATDEISIHAPARGATSILSKIHPMFLTISHNASSFSSFPFHSFLPHLLNSSTFCALFQVRISRAFSVYYRFAPKKSTPDL